MPYYIFQWTDEIIAHLAEHGVSPDDFEAIVCDRRALRRADERDGSPRSVALYELLDDGITVVPWSSYEVPEPRA